MERKQRLALICATVGVALGVGHLVQNNAAQNMAQVAAPAAPTQIQQVSAGPETGPKPAAAAIAPAVPEQLASAPVITPPDLAVPETPVPAPFIVADLSPGLILPGLAPPKAQLSEGPVNPLIITAPVPAPAPLTAPAVTHPTVIADACAPALRIAAAPQAMIGISLIAPCAPDTRVVIGQDGLTITAKTNAQGSLFLSMPALSMDATVKARLPDGKEVSQSVRVPAMATLRRIGVQWQNADAFQLHAFENGAGYGEAGHVSADRPQTPTTGLDGPGGFITVLGDASVPLPMMAEIYTFPAGIAANADITIEAAVTKATCGRELLGETIMTLAGRVYTSDLTLAMPDCDAAGDILVLKNLLTDLTIAAAN